MLSGIVIIKFVIFTLVLLINNSSTLLQFENPLKWSTFNSIIVLEKILDS